MLAENGKTVSAITTNQLPTGCHCLHPQSSRTNMTDLTTLSELSHQQARTRDKMRFEWICLIAAVVLVVIVPGV